MRGAAGLAYLLARASDTLADASAAPVEARLLALDGLAAAVSGGESMPGIPRALIEATPDPRERVLLESAGGLLRALGALPAAQAALVREVVDVITSGQRLDLERFAGATPGRPHALADDRMLEDYAWRVAGCVGAFWTQLGFLTLGKRFSREAEDVLLDRGVAFGKGLQLVNILRDLPADLGQGRCYLPVADPLDRDQLMAAHRRWCARAAGWVDEGLSYAAALDGRRVRTASALPAMIAGQTLKLLKDADWDTLAARVKVPRRAVYQALVRALLAPGADR